MRFNLVDRIDELEPGATIHTVKNLTMAEEYLAEHFPSFPVMPGVMMLEAVTQSAAWLVRVSEKFTHSIILLKEAKTVKYGQFVTPGHQLVMQCKLLQDDGTDAVLKVSGDMDGRTSVSAKIVVTRFNLADKHPIHRREDQRLRAHHLRTFQMLATPALREKLLGLIPEDSAV
jgi:3-hydroxyacyl-[acyl-carrier-protein] dehydratase